MEYKNEQLNVSFRVQDAFTVREQMAYYSAAAMAGGEDFFAESWLAARSLIQDWNCPDVPLNIDIDTDRNPKAARVLMWAAMRVREHLDRLDTIEKNS